LHRVKKDSYTAVVPCVVLCSKKTEALSEAFDAGADEVIRDGMQSEEAVRRLTAMLIRSERDLVVHPSTRLAGTSAIEAEIGRRLALGDAFAVCYADLDHFKEFNDSYSYNEGDRVIRILAKLLHVVV
jgi:GGDEF domain-containing protein